MYHEHKEEEQITLPSTDPLPQQQLTRNLIFLLDNIL